MEQPKTIRQFAFKSDATYMGHKVKTYIQFSEKGDICIIQIHLVPKITKEGKATLIGKEVIIRETDTYWVIQRMIAIGQNSFLGISKEYFETFIETLKDIPHAITHN